MLIEIIVPLIAAEGLVTFVATKVTKKAFSRNASLPHGAFALQIRQNLVRKSFAHSLCSHMPRASAKLAFPLQPHKTTIVLPDFIRSCSADGKKKKHVSLKNTLYNPRSKAGKGLTEKRAGRMAGMPV